MTGSEKAALVCGSSRSASRACRRGSGSLLACEGARGTAAKAAAEHAGARSSMRSGWRAMRKGGTTPPESPECTPSSRMSTRNVPLTRPRRGRDRAGRSCRHHNRVRLRARHHPRGARRRVGRQVVAATFLAGFDETQATRTRDSFNIQRRDGGECGENRSHRQRRRSRRPFSAPASVCDASQSSRAACRGGRRERRSLRGRVARTSKRTGVRPLSRMISSQALDRLVRGPEVACWIAPSMWPWRFQSWSKWGDLAGSRM